MFIYLLLDLWLRLESEKGYSAAQQGEKPCFSKKYYTSDFFFCQGIFAKFLKNAKSSSFHGDYFTASIEGNRRRFFGSKPSGAGEYAAKRYIKVGNVDNSVENVDIFMISAAYLPFLTPQKKETAPFLSEEAENNRRSADAMINGSKSKW